MLGGVCSYWITTSHESRTRYSGARPARPWGILGISRSVSAHRTAYCTTSYELERISTVASEVRLTLPIYIIIYILNTYLHHAYSLPNPHAFVKGIKSLFAFFTKYIFPRSFGIGLLSKRRERFLGVFRIILRPSNLLPIPATKSLSCSRKDINRRLPGRVNGGNV